MTRYFQSKVTMPWLAAWKKGTPTDLLLVLEWIFLASAILTNTLLPSPGQSPAAIPLLSPLPPWQVFVVIAFGIMGLKRPKQNLGAKVLYTIAELALVYSPIFLAPRLSYIFPPLHLIVVIRSCSMFGLLGQVIATIFADLLFLAAMFSQRFDITVSHSGITIPQVSTMLLTMRLNAVFAFMLISTFILLLVNALFSIQRSRQELAHAHDRLRQYALQIEDQATLQERNRIAREMHDALGHSLTAQAIQLDTVHYFWISNPYKAFQSLNEAKRLSSQALNDVRQAISTLRADPLQGLSLDGAIAKLLQTFHRSSGIMPSCTLRLVKVPPTNVSLCVYRVVQEALTNIAKHSRATDVNIYLQTTPKQLNVLIQDNGVGFDQSQNISGFGIQGMQERTLALGGIFSIVSQLGLGCKVMAQIPYSELQ